MPLLPVSVSKMSFHVAWRLYCTTDRLALRPGYVRTSSCKYCRKLIFVSLSRGLKRYTGTWYIRKILLFFTRKATFCNFLFALLYIRTLLKRDQVYKDWILSQGLHIRCKCKWNNFIEFSLKRMPLSFLSILARNQTVQIMALPVHSLDKLWHLYLSARQIKTNTCANSVDPEPLIRIYTI